MRIIHVTNSSDTTIAGIERHVLSLAAAQKARGFSTMVMLDKQGLFAESCREHGIPVVVEEDLSAAAGLYGLAMEKTTQGLVNQFKNFNAELIHCHTLISAAQAIPAGNQIGIPCVFTHHTGEAMQSLITAKEMGMSFTTVSVSKLGFENLKKIGMPETDLYYVPNGTKVVSSVRPEMRRSRRPNLILVGRMALVKGIDIAILAMAELRRMRDHDCPALNVYGDGPQEKFLKEMVMVLGLSDIVRFHGTQANILDYCPSTDVLIVPSRSEAGPIVALEAMSRGIPTVAFDVGEVAEMLPDRRYGRVVPVNSIMALAGGIDSLLSDIADGNFDPNLLIARHRSLYTSEKMAARIEVIYKHALLHRSPLSRSPAQQVLASIHSVNKGVLGVSMRFSQQG